MKSLYHYIFVRKWGLLIALAWFAVDQITKHLAVFYLKGQAPVAVIDGFFNLRFALNRGVSFSLFGNVTAQYWPQILGVFAIVMAAIFMHWMGKQKECRIFTTGLSFVAGGALGNGVDRFLHSAVVDFLDFYYDKHHWPTFNVADIAIFLGVSLILWSTHIHENTKRKNVSKTGSN